MEMNKKSIEDNIPLKVKVLDQVIQIGETKQKKEHLVNEINTISEAK